MNLHLTLTPYTCTFGAQWRIFLHTAFVRHYSVPPRQPSLRSAGSLAIINCDTIGISQLKKDKLCTRAMSIEFSVIFVYFVDQSFLAVDQIMSE